MTTAKVTYDRNPWKDDAQFHNVMARVTKFWRTKQSKGGKYWDDNDKRFNPVPNGCYVYMLEIFGDRNDLDNPTHTVRVAPYDELNGEKEIFPHRWWNNEMQRFQYDGKVPNLMGIEVDEDVHGPNNGIDTRNIVFYDFNDTESDQPTLKANWIKVTLHNVWQPSDSDIGYATWMPERDRVKI